MVKAAIALLDDLGRPSWNRGRQRSSAIPIWQRYRRSLAWRARYRTATLKF